jgi:hypothetical protein
MHPAPTVTITCDSLVEFTEDAAAFAQGEPEFVNGAPAPSGESAATHSSPPGLPSGPAPSA